MKSKQGGIGNFLVFFAATIGIILVLSVYIFVGIAIKKVNNVGEDDVVFNEENVDIDNIFSYSSRHILLTKAKILIKGGSDVGEALSEVGYEK